MRTKSLFSMLVLLAAVAVLAQPVSHADDPPADDPPAVADEAETEGENGDAPADEPADEEPAEEQPEPEAPATEEEPTEEEPTEEEPAEEEKQPEEKQPEEPPAPEYSVEEVVTGLHNPSGLAIQPGTGHVFVADSGSGKIIRFNPAEKETDDVVTDFPLDAFGVDEKRYEIGPLGLVFLNRDTLVVGCGGQGYGKDLIRVYDVPAWGTSIPADQMKKSLGPLEAADDAPGDGRFYALALTTNALYAATSGEATQGWIARTVRQGEAFTPLERYIATKQADETNAAIGLTISPMGRIVVGRIGDMGDQKDSRLTFYSAVSGNMLMDLPTGLYDVVGLAYSPRGNNLLYAVDFAWAKPEEGGLFRLDDDGKRYDDEDKGVTLVEIVKIDKPSALCFDDEGAIYVTSFGTPGDEEEKPGKLLRVTVTNGQF